MFFFQKPGESGFIQSFDKAAGGAIEGGGVFAFATRSGIDRLLTTPNLQGHLTAGRQFRLIVGLDAITNGDALLALEDYAGRFPALQAFAFLHDRQGTFHPKFCWFESATMLTIISGSNNLTQQGLGFPSKAGETRGNWEAFSEQAYSGQNATTARAEFENWFNDGVASNEIRQLSNPDVRNQAMANSRVRYVRPKAERSVGNTEVVETLVPGFDSEDLSGQDQHDDVLIRELPKNRLGQADVGKRVLEFMGFKSGAVDVLLQYVGLDNSVGIAAPQRLFRNKSSNYRLELSPVTQYGYDIGAGDERMILVIVRLAPASFRYSLVPVNDPNYATLSALLGPIAKIGKSRDMRLTITDSAALTAGWKDAPAKLLPDQTISVVV